MGTKGRSASLYPPPETIGAKSPPSARESQATPSGLGSTARAATRAADEPYENGSLQGLLDSALCKDMGRQPRAVWENALVDANDTEQGHDTADESDESDTRPFKRLRSSVTPAIGPDEEELNLLRHLNRIRRLRHL